MCYLVMKREYGDSELVKWIFNTVAETIRKRPRMRKFKLKLNAEKVTSNLIQR